MPPDNPATDLAGQKNLNFWLSRIVFLLGRMPELVRGLIKL
jgi:hypothetical protein